MSKLKCKYLFCLPTILTNKCRINRFTCWYENMLKQLGQNDYRVLLAIDKDDDITMAEAKKVTNDNPNFFVHQGQYKNCICKLIDDVVPIALQKYNPDVLCWMNDDHFIHDNMMPKIDDLFHEKISANKYAFLHVNDLLQKDEIATVYFITKSYYDLLGYLYNPNYAFGYRADREAVIVSQALGVWNYRPDIIIEHQHHKYTDQISKKNQDEFYVKTHANGQRVLQHDFTVFGQRKKMNFGIDELRKKMDPKMK